MKATVFVAAMSLMVLSLTLNAQDNPSKISPSVTSKNVSTLINLNNADLGVLIGSFKGIGKKRAEAIVNHRDNHGPFKDVSELAQVKGLGKAFVEGHLTDLRAVFSVH